MQYDRLARESARLERELEPLRKLLLRNLPKGESIWGSRGDRLRVLKVFVCRAWVPSFWRRSFYSLNVRRA
jgi:hypothetical protein